ncbi:hypothetical protein ACN6MY_19760 [Peribacillus sp. B-H-3]|uniref:hypothetical protein n=1 Tax=Peribacillus sp. B-H-3 TaxID=3400420 RepID=UPI003B0146D8
MPEETKVAVEYALTQTYTDSIGDSCPITKESVQLLVDKVREYFNTNEISYSAFSYADLEHICNWTYGSLINKMRKLAIGLKWISSLKRGILILRMLFFSYC